MKHLFHIPVLGLAFSIDSAVKVARYGISSTLSIVDDELIERMRLYYSKEYNYPSSAIAKKEDDFRAKRITAYLNLLDLIIDKQIQDLKKEDFVTGTDLTKYFELLPESTKEKQLYNSMLLSDDKQVKQELQDTLRKLVSPGAIDVNIMSKLDKVNYDKNGEELDAAYCDAVAALRGFANSTLSSSVVLSAGMNPRLYSQLAELDAFKPDQDGLLRKKVILKVSDYRSALIQAKYLAKKGVWISEFRVESGLNCGGHAFATDGYLLGPILEEFKQKKQDLINELSATYLTFWNEQGKQLKFAPNIRFTLQGGIGTAAEQNFLLKHYEFDGTGWGSPFLLVPEATTVDDKTLYDLAHAKEEDFYISNSSPLGVLFNNFKKSTAEAKRLERIEKNRPGSPCLKKYLVANKEFSTAPICTASREYQNKKILQLNELNLTDAAYKKSFDEITEKTCLCEGLATAAYIKYDIAKRKEDTSVSICPGPNTAYFNGVYSLKQMVDHIYGRVALNLAPHRPHMFINELQLYIEYFERYITTKVNDNKQLKFAEKFKSQLLDGISYYLSIFDNLSTFQDFKKDSFLKLLLEKKQKLELAIVPSPSV